MIRDAGRLTDDPRFERLALKHEESLAKGRFGRFAKPRDILTRLTFYRGKDLVVRAKRGYWAASPVSN